VRRSPVEIVANMASYVTRTPVADLSGMRGGWLGRWTDGVVAMRGDCVAFASHWELHNDRIAAESGPLWVVLGDSTAQGLGAPGPESGYVGQVLAELRQRTGQRWRVLNLSTSGALIRDVLQYQLPRLPAVPDLVTCGIGANDILYTAPWSSSSCPGPRPSRSSPSSRDCSVCTWAPSSPPTTRACRC
jgi:hypothetical protein